MKNEKNVKNKKKAAAESKMSLAARKAWETRKKKPGIEKKKSSEVVVEQLKRAGRRKKSRNEPEVVVEQLKKGYRKGVLMNKEKRSQVHMNSVMLTGKHADRGFVEFLNGLTREQVLVNKLCDVCWRRKWCEADQRAKEKARLVEPMKVPKVLVVQ